MYSYFTTGADLEILEGDFLLVVDPGCEGLRAQPPDADKV